MASANQQQQQLIDDTSAYLHGWKLFIVIACLYCGSFLLAIDINIINVAIPQISTDFHALGSVAWYGTSYLLLITAMQPVYGSLYKHFRNDLIYRISVVIFEVGSVLCAAAVNSPMFIAGRALAGLGGAGLLQGALSIISQVVKLEQRAMYNGIVISVFVITNTVGPILGGIFTQHVTWRWCFWINLPVGAVVIIGLSFFLRIKSIDTPARKLPFRQKLERLDPVGCLVFLSAVCCLLLALQWGGQEKAWDSADVLGCLVGAFALGILFIVTQWYQKEQALIPLRIFAKRSIWTGVMVLFFIGAETSINTFFMSFWFQAVLNLSPVQAGVNFIALMVPQIITVMIVSGIVNKYGHYVPWMLLGEVIAIAGQAMLTQIHQDTKTAYWAAGFVVTGVGVGLAQQLPYTAVAAVLSDQDIPVGNALAVLFYQLGSTISISLGQTITFSTILNLVPKRIPSLPPRAVIKVGATALASLGLPPDQLSVLRDIWNTGIARTIIFSTVCLAAAVPFTLGMECLNAVKIGQQRRQEQTALQDGDGENGDANGAGDDDGSDARSDQVDQGKKVSSIAVNSVDAEKAC